VTRLTALPLARNLCMCCTHFSYRRQPRFHQKHSSYLALLTTQLRLTTLTLPTHHTQPPYLPAILLSKISRLYDLCSAFLFFFIIFAVLEFKPLNLSSLTYKSSTINSTYCIKPVKLSPDGFRIWMICHTIYYSNKWTSWISCLELHWYVFFILWLSPLFENKMKSVALMSGLFIKYDYLSQWLWLVFGFKAIF
jgi:hypothetical protein